MDAIALLKADHEAVETKFARFEALTPRARKSMEKIVADVIVALSVHASIEEMVLYPAARARLLDRQPAILEALEEHHLAKVTMAELRSMHATDERYAAKFTVLMESIRHHVREEEKTLFPALRKAFTRAELIELGTELAHARAIAPTRPHPKAPDSFPANVLTGAATAPIDAVRHAGEEVVRRAREAIGRR